MQPSVLLREGAASEACPEGALPAKAHVCFVAPRLWPVLSGNAELRLIGGAEVQQAVLVRQLRQAGYRVSVVTQDFGQPQCERLEGIVVHKTFHGEAGIPVLRFLHPRLTATWRALLAADADIYYVRSASMLAGVVAGFCRRHGKRSLYAAASDADFVPGHRQIRYARDRLIYAYGLRRVDRIVVQNRAQLDACREHWDREATLIPSCYEPPHRRSTERPEVVLWSGRLTPDKRPEVFLELARSVPERRFVLVGGASDEERAYERRLREKAASIPNLELTGFLPFAEAETWFDRARVLVNTSLYEGLPNTFLQAWARGVPTVATVDVGAPVNTVFRDVQTGAGEIARLCNDEIHWSAVSRRCREYFARTHSCAEAIARYARLFEELTR